MVLYDDGIWRVEFDPSWRQVYQIFYKEKLFRKVYSYSDVMNYVDFNNRAYRP